MSNYFELTKNSIEVMTKLRYLFATYPELSDHESLQVLVKKANEWQSSFNAYINGDL